MFFAKKKIIEEKISEAALIEKAQKRVQENPLDCYCTFIKDNQRNSLAMINHSNIRLLHIEIYDLFNSTSTLLMTIDDNIGHIQQFDVTRKNVGIGDILMNELFYQAKLKHVEKIDGSLLCNPKESAEAIRFFQSKGFEIEYFKETKKLILHKTL